MKKTCIQLHVHIALYHTMVLPPRRDIQNLLWKLELILRTANWIPRWYHRCRRRNRSERQDMQMVFAFAFVFLITSHPSIKRVNSTLSWLLYVTLPDTYHYRWHRAAL